MDELADCAICPRECHANRFTGPAGMVQERCLIQYQFHLYSQGRRACDQRNKGICNVFFEHCNLQCIYCQNHQISDNRGVPAGNYRSLEMIVSEISTILDQGINLVGFVSPSHNIPQMLAIIEAVKSAGYNPRWVYNSNGFDKAATLRRLEGIIDIYLPDLKYMDHNLSDTFSDAENYPPVAGMALKEMFRQKGNVLHLGLDGTAESGIIIRHLVLPGEVENSMKVIRFIAGELSPKLHVSLMSQYYPAYKAIGHPSLGRSVTREEYKAVCDEMEQLGMFNGWVQEFESNASYRPDFRLSHPFEG